MQSTQWVLKTEEDVLGRLRTFLADLWSRAALEGLLVPTYHADQGLPGPRLLLSPTDLPDADPFIPLVRINSARLVEQLARQRPHARLAAVLRSCEARALSERSKRNGFSLANWLLIGVDCLASFSQSDFDWRLDKAGDIHLLSQQVLRNARQGGISPDRFRMACQMCTLPGAHSPDLCIHLIGLPIKQFALLSVHNPSLAQRLALPAISDGRAPDWLLDQHARISAALQNRHARFKQRFQAELQASLPADVDTWIQHLHGCHDCRACLEACPLYIDQLDAGRSAVIEWLSGCVACGMCEEACPKGLPLTAILDRIHQDLLLSPALA